MMLYIEQIVVLHASLIKLGLASVVNIQLDFCCSSAQSIFVSLKLKFKV